MAELQKAFTAHKLNWLDCVVSDRRLKPAAFKIAYAIMQHVNSETLFAWLSDETLVDVTGISSAEVQRHRKSLKACGWLTWKRTGNANVYTPLFDQLPEGLEFILDKRRKRKKLREARRAARAATPVTSVQSPVMDHDPSPVMDHDPSPAINIHLRKNTSGLTPTNTIPSLRSGVTSAEETDATRALKWDYEDHQPKAPYLQSDEAAERAMQELRELPFNTEWCGGLDEWGADFKPMSDRSDRAVRVYWKRLLRAPYHATDVVMVAKRVLCRTPRHQRSSLAGFLARFESYLAHDDAASLPEQRAPATGHHHMQRV
ncbi:helix-turn-helix domain-containing protein [Bradyrhizobium sp. 18]|uniref:helix-turn-helix domain-containing protein n=1 Tax=Bradyrhizobium sp. 18 TaxID=2782657 RepID=UPI001FFB6866|nr:helix-turn-helix domain-containing protein [Bradyrhizobium sp. 18]MCK1507557.1 helix-turn-helix domain-containing protein [Bradyrhizobium sp. 18]